MTPYKRGNVYYTWPTLPGHGRVGPWSLGTKDRRLAVQIESAIKDLPLTYPELVPELVAGRLHPRQLREAILTHTVPQLLERARTRPLDEAVWEWERLCGDQRTREGGPILLRIAEGLTASPSLSWLADNLLAVWMAREAEGVKRNTVHRTLVRFACEMLDHNAVRYHRPHYPKRGDRRPEQLSPAEIGALIRAPVEEQYRYFLGLAITTGLDLAPLTRITGRDYTEPRLVVRDFKTEARIRTIELGEAACLFLRIALARQDPPFPYSYQQHRSRWVEARAAIGRPTLRFKDLRSVAASYIVDSGATTKELQQILGHANASTTLKYTQPVRSRRLLSKAEEAMGLRDDAALYRLV